MPCVWWLCEKSGLSNRQEMKQLWSMLHVSAWHNRSYTARIPLLTHYVSVKLCPCLCSHSSQAGWMAACKHVWSPTFDDDFKWHLLLAQAHSRMMQYLSSTVVLSIQHTCAYILKLIRFGTVPLTIVRQCCKVTQGLCCVCSMTRESSSPGLVTPPSGLWVDGWEGGEVGERDWGREGNEFIVVYTFYLVMLLVGTYKFFKLCIARCEWKWVKFGITLLDSIYRPFLLLSEISSSHIHTWTVTTLWLYSYLAGNVHTVPSCSVVGLLIPVHKLSLRVGLLLLLLLLLEGREGCSQALEPRAQAQKGVYAVKFFTLSLFLYRWVIFPHTD